MSGPDSRDAGAQRAGGDALSRTSSGMSCGLSVRVRCGSAALTWRVRVQRALHPRTDKPRGTHTRSRAPLLSVAC
eukprot:1201643-Rhodomonas_salina.2